MKLPRRKIVLIAGIGLPILLVVSWMLASGGGEEAKEPSAVATNSTTASGIARPGSLIVSLFPESPTSEESLSLQVTQGGGISCRWERNGQPIQAADTCNLSSSLFARGDEITVHVSSANGSGSAGVVIANSPPRIKAVRVSPGPYQRGVDIVAKGEAEDRDGDEVRFRNVWRINGDEVIGETGEILSGNRFAKGDKVTVEVIPEDGEAAGAGFDGGEFVIGNAQPRFVSEPPPVDGFSYSYIARVEDPDQDPLIYSLVEGPAGMAIDPASGAIGWEIGREASGEHRIKIAARDSEQAEAVQEFTLKVGFAN